MTTRRNGKGFEVRQWSALPRFEFVGAKMRSFLSPEDTAALSCYHVSLSGREKLSPAYHKKAFELIWILDGGGVALMGGGRSVALRKGDSLLIHPREPHGFTAGARGLVFLAALSPRVDSQTDYYSCHGTHEPPRISSGRLLEGRARGNGRAGAAAR